MNIGDVNKLNWHELKKGQILDLTIESIAPGGEGVAKFNNFTIFVDRAACGDVARVKLFDLRKDFAKGKIESLIKASDKRQEPPCPYFERCGGCQWQHMHYEAQLEAKQSIVRQSLERIGKIQVSEDMLMPTLGSDPNFRYRNKSQLPVQKGQKIKDSHKRMLKVGYFEKNSHDLVNLNQCPIQPEELDQLMNRIRDLLEDFGLPAYDEKTQKGLLRHILMRQAWATKEILVTFVLFAQTVSDLSEKTSDSFKKIALQLKKEFVHIKGVGLNFNHKAGNRIMGATTLTIEGADCIEEVITSNDSFHKEVHKKGLRFRLSAASFFQVNTKQAGVILERIYKDVFGDDTENGIGNKTILDAYAGVGTIALWMAPGAAKVLAVEENPFAIADGKHNLSLNQINNVEFIQGDVEQVLAELVQKNFKPDCIILDPPRKGVSPAALESILQLAPQKIVYMSCNPVTLARDLARLNEGMGAEIREIRDNNGYKIERILPFDMFPQTYHVESLALLKRKA